MESKINGNNTINFEKGQEPKVKEAVSPASIDNIDQLKKILTEKNWEQTINENIGEIFSQLTAKEKIDLIGMSIINQLPQAQRIQLLGSEGVVEWQNQRLNAYQSQQTGYAKTGSEKMLFVKQEPKLGNKYQKPLGQGTADPLGKKEAFKKATAAAYSTQETKRIMGNLAVTDNAALALGFYILAKSDVTNIKADLSDKQEIARFAGTKGIAFESLAAVVNSSGQFNLNAITELLRQEKIPLDLINTNLQNMSTEAKEELKEKVLLAIGKLTESTLTEKELIDANHKLNAEKKPNEQVTLTQAGINDAIGANFKSGLAELRAIAIHLKSSNDEKVETERYTKKMLEVETGEAHLVDDTTNKEKMTEEMKEALSGFVQEEKNGEVKNLLDNLFGAD